MSPTEVKNIESKINLLEKKLDYIIYHFIGAQQADDLDWFDDPKIFKFVQKEIQKAEIDFKLGRYQKAQEVFNELGI